MTSNLLCRAALRRQTQFLARPPQRRWQSSPNRKSEEPIPVPNTVPPPPPPPPPAVETPFWMRLGPLTRATQAYGRAQRKRPWVVQLCTSLTIFCLGDMCSQRIGGKDYDPVRTGRAIIIGGVISIPNFEWFMFLSRNFNYASKLLSIATKIVVNQVVFTPLFNSYFFGMQALLAGDTLVECWERIKRTVPTSMKNSVKLWPIVTAINFTMVPIEFRSVFAGVIAVGWQTYLSWLNRLAEDHEAKYRLEKDNRISSSSEMMTASS
ncbi:unnamed protein product [Discula destructiva]